MSMRNCIMRLMIVLLLPVFTSAFAQDKKISPEELVAAHLKSIGSPEALKSLKSRILSGIAGANFVQGWSGSFNNGAFVIASEPSKFGMVVQYSNLEYPGERFGFDGKDVVVGNIKPGQRSPLADFIFRNNFIVKEGLLGGTMSLAWPLLNTKDSQPDLKVSEGKLDGKPVWEVEYRKKSLGQMRVKMFFDAENFHHLRTEYRVTHKSDMTSANNVVSSAPLKGYEDGQARPNATIMEGVADSNYQLIEKFENYQAAGGLTLPYSYSIEYEVQGQGSSFVGHWGMRANGKFTNNGEIEPSFYRAISIR